MKKEALISRFNTHFLNPLASSTASGWMQRERSVKLKKLYALNVGKRLKDKYIRYIHRRGPSKLRRQSSLQVHYKTGKWCFITNAYSHPVFTASRFTCLEMYWLFQSDPRAEALVQSQPTRISNGLGLLFMCRLLFLPRIRHFWSLVVVKRNIVLSINAKIKRDSATAEYHCIEESKTNTLMKSLSQTENYSGSCNSSCISWVFLLETSPDSWRINQLLDIQRPLDCLHAQNQCCRFSRNTA